MTPLGARPAPGMGNRVQSLADPRWRSCGPEDFKSASDSFFPPTIPGVLLSLKEERYGPAMGITSPSLPTCIQTGVAGLFHPEWDASLRLQSLLFKACNPLTWTRNQGYLLPSEGTRWASLPCFMAPFFPADVSSLYPSLPWEQPPPTPPTATHKSAF